LLLSLFLAISVTISLFYPTTKKCL
jgi:hypothetical protein